MGSQIGTRHIDGILRIHATDILITRCIAKLSNDDSCTIPKIFDIDNEDSIPNPDDEKLSDKVVADLSNELNNRRSILYQWYDVFPNFRLFISCK